MLANNLRVTPIADGTLRVELTLPDQSSGNHLTMLANTCDKLNVDIKKYRKKRSLTANGLLWKLADELAKVLKSTKEEVYHEAVRKVGLYNEFEVDPKAVKALAVGWCSKGEGWQVEVSNEVTTEGNRVVRLYSGSSVYNTKQFSRLLEYIIDECKNLGIETAPQEEVDRLIAMIESR